MTKPKLWTSNLIFITSTNFFAVLNFYMLMVIVSVYAMETFRSSPSEAGLASGIFVIGSLVSRLFSGKWIERIGRRRMLFTGLISGLIMSLLYMWINSVVSLFVIRFVHGATFGITTIATLTIASNIIPKERYGEGLGYFALSTTVATAIGPFLSMFISQHGSFRTIFVTCIIAAALSCINCLFLTIPEIELTREQLEETKGFRLSSFIEYRVVPISIVCGILYICYSGIFCFLAVYAKEIHLTVSANYFFIVFAAAVLLSRPFTGRLFDVKGENYTMYPAIPMFAIGMIILSQAHIGYALLLAGAFIGLGLGAAQSSTQAISVKLTPSHRLGLANSTLFMFIDGTAGLGPFILGLFIPLTGYRGLYMVLSAVLLVGMFAYYLLHGRKVTPGKTA